MPSNNKGKGLIEDQTSGAPEPQDTAGSATGPPTKAVVILEAFDETDEDLLEDVTRLAEFIEDEQGNGITTADDLSDESARHFHQYGAPPEDGRVMEEEDPDEEVTAWYEAPTVTPSPLRVDDHTVQPILRREDTIPPDLPPRQGVPPYEERVRKWRRRQGEKAVERRKLPLMDALFAAIIFLITTGPIMYSYRAGMSLSFYTRPRSETPAHTLREAVTIESVPPSPLPTEKEPGPQVITEAPGTALVVESMITEKEPVATEKIEEVAPPVAPRPFPPLQKFTTSAGEECAWLFYKTEATEAGEEKLVFCGDLSAGYAAEDVDAWIHSTAPMEKPHALGENLTVHASSCGLPYAGKRTCVRKEQGSASR